MTVQLSCVDAAYTGAELSSRIRYRSPVEAAYVGAAIGPPTRRSALVEVVYTGAVAPPPRVPFDLVESLRTGAVLNAPVGRRIEGVESVRAGARLVVRVRHRLMLAETAYPGCASALRPATPTLVESARVGAVLAAPVRRRLAAFESLRTGAGLSPPTHRWGLAETAYAGAVAALVYRPRWTSIGVARAGGVCAARGVHRLSIVERLSARAALGGRCVRRGTLVERVFVSAVLPVERAGAVGWSADVRAWAMSEWRDVPFEEFSSRFALGPGGVYAPGEEEVAAWIKTGDLDSAQGAEVRLSGMQRVELAGHGRLTVRAETVRGARTRVGATYRLIGQSDALHLRNVEFGRGPSGRRWAITVGNGSGQPFTLGRLLIFAERVGI